MTTGPPIASPSTFAGLGASWAAASPVKIACSIIVAPRPPNSFGQELPAHPAACSLRCQSPRKAMTSSRKPSGSGPGLLARSQVATSSRNPSSDGDSVKSIERRPYPSSDPLDQGARPQPAAATHRQQPHLLVGALHLVQQRGQQAGAGAPERMAYRDRPAVDVDPVHVRFELALPGGDDRGEGLVDLDQVDVVDLHPVAFEELFRCRDR